MHILWPASLDLSQPLAEGPPTNGRNRESNTTTKKKKRTRKQTGASLVRARHVMTLWSLTTWQEACVLAWAVDKIIHLTTN